MADKKISELTNITGANLADGDELVVVDASASETKAITFGEFKNALDTATGFVSITGDTMTGDLALSGADITFGDNDKAIFGAGSDLQIYHDGSNSIITDGGSGSLLLRGSNVWIQNADGTETGARFITDGAIDLRYDNSVKLATTSTGIDVTGTVTADGLTVDNTGGAASVVTVSGNDQANVRITLDNNGSGGNEWEFVGGNHGANNADLTIYDKTNTAKRAVFSNNGDISFYEDTGTTPKFFWDASAERLGIGTSAPATQLEVENLSGNADFALTASNTSSSTVYFGDGDSVLSGRIQYNHPSNYMALFTNSSERMRIDSSGNVGIGTSSPTSALSILGSGTSPTTIDITSGFGVAKFIGQYGNVDIRADDNNAVSGSLIRMSVDGSEAMRIDSIGRVGIGTSTPSASLHVSGGMIRNDLGSAGTSLTLTGTGSNFQVNHAVSGYATLLNSGGGLAFNTLGSERMRIDSSGNLLVGKTSTAFGTAGNRLLPDGGIYGTKNGAAPFAANRLTSDGDIMSFWKDTSQVGSIGSRVGYLKIGSGDTGLLFNSASDAIYGESDTGGARDAAIDLGLSGVRFKDLYLSGGVYLGGTGAANKLDDYEEGSFSPMTTTLAQVYHARYTKIGNLVTINCSFQMLSGQSRNFISLPFTPAADGVGKNVATNTSTNNRYAGTVSYFTPASGSTPVNLMLFHQGNQGASAYFLSKDSTTQQSWPEAVDDTYGNIAVSFTYQTDS